MRPERNTKATVKKIGINGEGIAYLDKKITFIPGALPGEEVIVDIISNEPKFKMGKVKEIITPSEFRVTPKCKTQKDCLGCPLMIMDYKAQLDCKLQLVKDTFKKYMPEHFADDMLDTIVPSGQVSGFRNIVRLPVVDFNGRMCFGIYQRNTKYLTLMNGCMMQSKRINTLLSQIEELFASMHLRAYDEVKRKGVRFLTVREFDEGMQLIFVTGLDRLPDRFIDALKAMEDVKSVYVTVNTTRKQDFELQKYENKYGKTQMKQIFMQKPFIVSSKADFPVYKAHAIRVAKQIASMVNEDVSKVLDIGCGIGLYGLSLDDSIEVHGIDTGKININDAMNSASLQNRTNVHFEDGRIDHLFTPLSKKHHYDLGIVHLDMFTLRDDMIESMLASKTKYFIFESEHPSMMAKYMERFTSLYKVEEIIAIDGNPNGPGVHTIALMTRKK